MEEKPVKYSQDSAGKLWEQGEDSWDKHGRILKNSTIKEQRIQMHQDLEYLFTKTPWRE
jgi:hypothetical protein